MNNVTVKNNVGKSIDVAINYCENDTQVIINPANNVELKKLERGIIFKRNGVEYIVIEQFGDTTACVRKELLDEDREFDDENNNFATSDLKVFLNSEYLAEIERDFGAENIVSHSVNLLSLDGLNDYGSDTVKVSVPTIDLYRNNRKHFGENLDRAWWLATPDSTPSGCGSHDVRYVSSDGDVGYGGGDWELAVRPFFYLKSKIFVSC